MIQLHCRKNSKGFTLLEVLVAMVLLAIGLLGVARLQMFGLQNTGNAYFRTQASGLLTELVERVRANPAAALNNDYYTMDMPACVGAATPDCVSAACSTPGEVAQFDVYAVYCGLNGAKDGSGVDDLLPGGAMTIRCSNPNPAAVPCQQYRATMRWTETNDDDANGTGDTNTISMTFTP